MLEIWSFFKIFLANVSIMLTITYGARIVYTYFLVSRSRHMQRWLFIGTAIFAGIVSILFGAKLDGAVYDLRLVPIFAAAVILRESFPMVVIGVGIGIGRLLLSGFSDTAFAAFQTICLLSLVCAGLNKWMTSRRIGLAKRLLVLILAMYTGSFIRGALSSVIDTKTFITQTAPSTYPLFLLFSGLFVLMLRDFQREHEQKLELRQINLALEQEIRLSEEKTRELEKTKSDLEEKAVQLTLSNNFKSEFLANMSHELRTPLNSILILSQLMEENKQERLAEQDVESARLIHASGRDLLELINDILDLSKMEANKMEIVNEPVALADVPSVMRRSFDAVAFRKGVEFHVMLEEDLPQLFHSDAQRLYQILRNLLSNAFKFTHTGHVTLTIRKADLGAFTFLRPEYEWQYEGIAFVVEDTGIGMTHEQQEKVFQSFYQADGSITRKYGGTGLGLSISRSLAELLGGIIRVQSAPGAGSVFTLYLPLGAIPHPDPGAQRTEAAAAAEPGAATVLARSWDGRKLLAVDDDLRNIRAVTQILADTKIEVLAASNGKEAMEILERHPDISLVMMDLMMPEMDGYEAIRRIRALPRHEALPVIVLTAKAMTRDKVKSLEAGANEYLAKPLEVGKLHTLLDKYLS